MWSQRGSVSSKEGRNGPVAVAIDKEKSSQNALRWAADHLVGRGQTLTLIHVRIKPPLHPSQSLFCSRSDHLPQLHDLEQDQPTKDLFLPFHCYCTRKDVVCDDVILDDTDVVRALVEYVTQAAIENLVLGAPTKSGFLRFKMTDIPSSVTKRAPDFCNVYLVSKGKVSLARSASRPTPASLYGTQNQATQSDVPKTDAQNVASTKVPEGMTTEPVPSARHDFKSIKSPFTRGRATNGMSYGELSVPETDISFVSSDRLSSENVFSSSYDTMDIGQTPPRLSSCSDTVNPSFESPQFGFKSLESCSPNRLSSASHETDSPSWSPQAFVDVEAEMRRLKLELKQTMDMYSMACREALTAKQKAMELQCWKVEEEQRMERARLAEEAAVAMVAREKARSRAALEHVEAAKRMAELESQKRIIAELKVLREIKAKQKALNNSTNSSVRYRKYSIEEIEAATESFKEILKIGEGGYGFVYRCYLDHTQVAVKVLRPEAVQGRSQFQKEVDVLSCIRHPNMVLLLGACPEYGCLVYEYMANGSLEDRLFQRGNTPPLPWQLRFRIAVEIGTALQFLHQTKPEPLVHRDLKPGNVLLDRNFISKISDVGLARLVPAAMADSVTQYCMTSAAGTFCYIDPEYQQTGMLGVKSDIYSLGIMFLQLITGKPPMGLTYQIEQAIEKGILVEVLDPSVPDWPVEETLRFANVALKCAELRRKDRPDLGGVVLPELERLSAFAEENMQPAMVGWIGGCSSNHWKSFSTQDALSCSNAGSSDYGSS